MVYELISERNLTQGMHVLFTYANDVTNGLYITLLLMSIWSIVSLGLFFKTKDFPVSFTSGGFATTILAVILKMIPNLLTVMQLSTVIILTIVGFLWVVFSRE